MLRPGCRVLAAVSGGADSVFLLYALLDLAPLFEASVAGVAHLNHQLRGEESDADQRFVAALAGRLGVAFYGAESRVADSGGNLEAAARRARREFFAALLRQGAADCIATGHTRDDQAETVLFRMLRGSGGAGLAGILPVTREGLVRPLIQTSRAAVEQYLRDRQIAWREDSTNRDPRFARNRIRHALLPLLERDWNPELRDSLAHLADLAGQEERWWGAQIRKLAAKAAIERAGGVEIPASEIARLPKAVSRRLVRELIRRAGGRAAGFAHIEETLALASAKQGRGCLELPGLTVIRSFDGLRFAAGGMASSPPQAAKLEVAPGFRGRVPWDGGSICLEVRQEARRGAESTDSRCVRLKWKGQETAAFLELRAWQDGDHYRPFGHSRDQKLKEMFQKARIPSWERALWPIVTDGSRILWTRRFGVAEDLRVAARTGSPRGAWLRIWEEPASEQPGTKKDARR